MGNLHISLSIIAICSQATMPATDEWDGFSAADYESNDAQSAASYYSFADCKWRHELQRAEHALNCSNFTEFLRAHSDIQFAEPNGCDGELKALKYRSMGMLIKFFRPHSWQKLNLQQKKLLVQIINIFFRPHSWPGRFRMRFRFRQQMFFFLGHSDPEMQSEVQGLIHPRLMFDAWMWTLDRFMRSKLRDKERLCKIRIALSIFISIFFGKEEASLAVDHKRMIGVVYFLGSYHEYRVLLNLLVTRYENRMKRTTLRPKGFLEHTEVQRIYQTLCALNDTESVELVQRINNISQQVHS